MRYEFTRAQQRAMLKRAGGHCECLWQTQVELPAGPAFAILTHTGAGILWRCNAPLLPRRFRYDHIDPTYIAARRVTESDGHVICLACDGAKYSTIDRPKIDRVRRLADRESGIRKPRRVLIPGSRGSGLRKKYDRRQGKFVTVRE